ncbi:hypothetical protein HIM_01143 [Hirsutella minnesotensis 3608]|nr:hypothetical protein HIM_01143 [Hirsutella minnesotensis 3608]
MPGILPMKVIKVGNSAQSRIAQACDRCRCKKIRCDGVRPTCSQCANVGFECRTSDKLSRRAFPRGYTESLEERVRQLEAEVRELKDLLDEKDEKIDVLSAMHGSHRRQSPAISAPNRESPTAQAAGREDTFRIPASQLVPCAESSESYFMGPSSGRSLITSLKRKLQESGKPSADMNPDAFLHAQGCPSLTAQEPDLSWQIPPRLFSDRCVNVFFQEWAPLFPVIHKPTFLRIYEEFVASPEKMGSSYKVAQLYLVYSIAGLSSESPDYRQVAACERRWIAALEALALESTMSTMQCLILAILHCTLRGNHKRLQHYKSVAVGLSHRLGLHQSQSRFPFSPLILETRKKVFWTLYTLDCFTAAAMGLPKLLKDEAIEAEYPCDMDDEYITEKGFQPTLPGESTRLSSALALFRASRILSEVLEKLYSTPANQELTLQEMKRLEGHLDSWYAELPAHLRLTFVQDKLSTDITGSRAPLLALTFYYIRTLIYRPAVGSTLGPKSAPALLSIADASKHLIQICLLLEERSMSFSFCLNKSDLLAVCGVTLLYQVVDLKHDSKLSRDIGRWIDVVIRALYKAEASCVLELERIARLLLHVEPRTRTPFAISSSQPGSLNNRLPQHPLSAQGAQLRQPGYVQNHYTHWQPSHGEAPESQDKGRRAPMLNGSHHGTSSYRVQSTPSSSEASAINVTGTGVSNSYSHSASKSSNTAARSTTCGLIPNLDYLSLNNTPSQTQPPSPADIMRTHSGELVRPQSGSTRQNRDHAAGKAAKVSTADWEALLGSMDGGLHNVYDAIYGGASLANEASPTTVRNTQIDDWSTDSWELSSFSVGDLAKVSSGQPQSAISISEESLSSGEEVAPSELGLSIGSSEHQKPYMRCGSGDSFGADVLEKHRQ